LTASVHQIKKISSLVALVSFALTSMPLGGCAGRAANPVSIYQMGDEQRSCGAIGAELEVMQDEILRLIPQSDKTARNWILGTAGFFLLVPYFFMDLSKAEQQEVNAYRHRYNYLLTVANDKGCALNRKALPDFSNKSVMKKFYEEKQTLFPEKS